MSSIYTIYIGYDHREAIAYDVLKESILDHSSIPINIIPLKQEELRRVNFYRRNYYIKDKNNYDTTDNKPFSTDFSFTRFLIPFLNRLDGYALFMDCDMMVRSDIAEVFESVNRGEDKAVWCVKHRHIPNTSTKMDDKIQTVYTRKNWSSFVLWNCSHEAHKNLTIDDVNLKTGWYLHNFKWLNDNDIGELPTEWNWLDGYSPEKIEAKNVHFTNGGPWFRSWKPTSSSDAKYALEWNILYDGINIEESLGKNKQIKWEKTYV
tara:strand:- start:9803 stop:10591 length:789 start_codon:yes stop_codon:yes gene_type:complete